MKTFTSPYKNHSSSVSKFIAFVLVVLLSFSNNAMAQFTYQADAILTSPVNPEGIANFLQSQKSTGSENARVMGNGDVDSPLFGGIQGPAEVCSFEEPVTYTVAIITDANGDTADYFWFVPQDWTILSGQGTNEISVLPGSMSGQVAVFAVGHCICSYACKVVTSEDCGDITPLPVELVSFNAARAQSTVLLDWSTATELNNEAFVIERSNDGRNFQNIGKVAGNGTTDRAMNYTFTDNSPVAAVTYYRLKQIDTDGKFEYSPVRAVDQNAETASVPVKAFPNPTAGMLKLELPTNTPGNATITLVSITGQTMFTGTAGSLSADNAQIDMSRYTSGMYILNINSDTNTQSLRISKL